MLPIFLELPLIWDHAFLGLVHGSGGPAVRQPVSSQEREQQKQVCLQYVSDKVWVDVNSQVGILL